MWRKFVPPDTRKDRLGDPAILGALRGRPVAVIGRDIRLGLDAGAHGVHPVKRASRQAAGDRAAVRRVQNEACVGHGNRDPRSCQKCRGAGQSGLDQLRGRTHADLEGAVAVAATGSSGGEQQPRAGWPVRGLQHKAGHRVGKAAIITQRAKLHNVAVANS